MDKLTVVSLRDIEHWPSWHLVYEWEDEIVKAIPNARIYKRKEIYIAGKRLFENIRRRLGIDVSGFSLSKTPCFYYDMSPSRKNEALNKPYNNVCIIDYCNRNHLDELYKSYSNVGHLFISSREAYDFLVESKFGLPVEHLPLTLPDKYAITPETKIDKEYDLIIQGRQSPVLLDYLDKYEKTHNVNICRRGKVEGNNFPYYDGSGKFVGMGNTREEYINLLRKSRVAFYSTSGIDGDPKKDSNNGFHQVTPRFLEEIACGCNVISRYVDNSDTDWFELGKMSTRVNSYEEFEAAMDKAIATPPDMAVYAKYLEKHYTSVIAKRLAEIII